MLHFLWFGLHISQPVIAFCFWFGDDPGYIKTVWLERFGWSPSGWKVIYVKWQETILFPPDFFSKPSKLLASLVSILLVPVSHTWFRVTNHSDEMASQRLFISQQLNTCHHPVKTFTSFAVELSFVAGKDILIHLQLYLPHLLQCSL